MSFMSKFSDLANTAKNKADEAVDKTKKIVNESATSIRNAKNDSDINNIGPMVDKDYIPKENEGVLTISRENQTYIVNPKIKIIINDELVYYINDNQTIYIPLNLGKYNISFSMPLRKADIEFDFNSNTFLNIHIDSGSGSINLSGSNKDGDLNINQKHDTLSSVTNKVEHSICGDSDKGNKREGTIFELYGRNGQLFVYENKIEIERKGALGFLSQGLSGSKTIPISAIQSIQVKQAGAITNGFIQFGVLGGNEATGGMSKACNDENTIMSSENETMLKIKEYIEKKIYNKGNETKTVINQQSAADEILKFKNLLDQGIITQDEFDKKKKNLLGI